MSISDEFAFIKAIQPQRLFHENKVVGIGDDAAIVDIEDGFEKVICVDTMVEDIHFTKKTMSPKDIGFKALAANISDVAAMGGIPLYYLVSITIPTSWSQTELQEIYEGMQLLGDEYKMDLIGGDTTSGKALVLSVFVIGKIEKGKRLLRSNAVHQDVVFVSGTVGNAAAGLDILLHSKQYDDCLVAHHQRPKPQVTLGRLLSEFDRVALNDVSDGLSSELLEIAEASRVDIVINEEILPLSTEIMDYNREKAVEWAMTGGEDFELVGTIAENDWPMLVQKCENQGIRITAIGKVQSGSGRLFLETNEGNSEIKKSGFNHFKRS
ncbi:Thiamine-monophosphate kinase [Bacillus sp. THAF10]|uniref:thiamine-phosphate kinase n=1 Tax=Bacillus sp. THAF10 TaxID=2587848 RepID=UPI00126833A6|nr:thiamine-phosphate kinase [Bacillus sp. THAF10]QFT87368.1 Thiamine-monophosphate kinase [Bacillus sp. THAF10]